MVDGIIRPPDTGTVVRTLGLDVTIKLTAQDAKSASSFELLVNPGFDVGAHVHSRLEELFYVVEGELDLIAFEPQIRTPDNWHAWQSQTGEHAVRGGPGTMMFVPIGCPHAFSNPGTVPARMFLQVAPPGHERYFEELGQILARSATPDRAAIAALRQRYDTEQLTPLLPGHT